MKITKTNDMLRHFLKMVIYSESGGGKTRLAATTGAPTVVISAEGGLLSPSLSLLYMLIRFHILLLHFYIFFTQTFFVKPEKNVLYVFPSWLQHFVDANMSQEERISLSFNTKLVNIT
mgnify:CR=1 FL=1